METCFWGAQSGGRRVTTSTKQKHDVSSSSYASMSASAAADVAVSSNLLLVSSRLPAFHTASPSSSPSLAAAAANMLLDIPPLYAETRAPLIHGSLLPSRCSSFSPTRELNGQKGGHGRPIYRFPASRPTAAPSRDRTAMRGIFTDASQPLPAQRPQCSAGKGGRLHSPRWFVRLHVPVVSFSPKPP
ncbi:hypothetical protein PCL_00386 [Purpureocillium lilacinum]|uniref:Uncharacterized protein n=1 Tax=Purpureocillium lilacinum TaxID=33203 RepID=A0A2U3E6W0_PURLI|nr:hypothetical protein Purlil1_8910 [Purpureocillium lilacinum]PWI70242.1 hypothetical protein PCL_00386 [Purpureocillium lilacinum]